MTVPAGLLANGKTYRFRTSPYDGLHYNNNWSAWAYFTVDTSAPSAPTAITSTDYPSGQWVKGAGQSGVFTVTPPSGDQSGLEWSLDGTTWTEVATNGTAPVALTVTPAKAGTNTLQVRASDRAENKSEALSYTFQVGAGGVTAPNDGHPHRRPRPARGRGRRRQVHRGGLLLAPLRRRRLDRRPGRGRHQRRFPAHRLAGRADRREEPRAGLERRRHRRPGRAGPAARRLHRPERRRRPGRAGARGRRPQGRRCHHHPGRTRHRQHAHRRPHRQHHRRVVLRHDGQPHPLLPRPVRGRQPDRPGRDLRPGLAVRRRRRLARHRVHRDPPDLGDLARPGRRRRHLGRLHRQRGRQRLGAGARQRTPHPARLLRLRGLHPLRHRRRRPHLRQGRPGRRHLDGRHQPDGRPVRHHQQHRQRDGDGGRKDADPPADADRPDHRRPGRHLLGRPGGQGLPRPAAGLRRRHHRHRHHRPGDLRRLRRPGRRHQALGHRARRRQRHRHRRRGLPLRQHRCAAPGLGPAPGHRLHHPVRLRDRRRCGRRPGRGAAPGRHRRLPHGVRQRPRHRRGGRGHADQGVDQHAGPGHHRHRQRHRDDRLRLRRPADRNQGTREPLGRRGRRLGPDRPAHRRHRRVPARPGPRLRQRGRPRRGRLHPRRHRLPERLRAAGQLRGPRAPDHHHRVRQVGQPGPQPERRQP